MNNNRNLITHIMSDPNAWKHMLIGFAVSLVAVLIAQWPLAPLVAAFLAGVGIEVVQRLQGGRNSLRESTMDVLTTTIGGLPAFLWAVA